MAILSEEEVQRRLRDVPQWHLAGSRLERGYSFQDFAAALAFVNRVAEIAEELDHHPDIDIRYTNVKLSLISHDSGGLTARDFRLARALDQEVGG